MKGKAKICLRLCAALMLTGFLSAFSVSLAAADLPVLPTDSSVSSGTLPCGITYYLCKNSSAKGLIRFSLVQKLDPLDDTGLVSETARKRFSSVRLGESSLEGFLSRNGFSPYDGGYIAVDRGQIVYRFDSYDSARGQAVLDSTLLSVFTLARVSGDDGQVSSAQAVIASGDFDSAFLLDRLKVFSMLCDKVDGKVQVPQYKWNPDAAKDGLTLFSGDAQGVEVKWYGARTPEEYMKTVLPVISAKLSGEFDWVLKSRLYPIFRSEGLHVYLEGGYHSSGEGYGDEYIWLKAFCMKKYRTQVRDIMERELDRLYTWGVDEVEYAYARDAYRNRWRSRSFAPVHSNDEISRRCGASFLWGGSLSAPSQQMSFAYKDIPEDVQTTLFNDYMRGLLSQTSSADSTLAKMPVPVRREVVENAISEYIRTQYVLKAPKDKDEYVSGGLMWTFSNGMNVVFKKVSSDGYAYFSLASRGRRENADEDFFSSIDGVYEEDFSNYLSSLGIELSMNLTPCDVRLSGKVPAENFGRLMDVLVALVSQKENAAAFGPDCYKMFVVAGDMDEYALKKQMCSYAALLGRSGPWMAGDASSARENEVSRDLLPENYVCREAVFPLDITGANYALGQVGRVALLDVLRREFCGSSALVGAGGDFVGFPSFNYRLAAGAALCPPENFAIGESVPSEEEIQEKLTAAVRSLASGEISAERLKMYKGIASNAFTTYKSTPQYVIDAVNYRYMDNKDLLSAFDKNLAAVSAADLLSFFKAASYL